MNSTGHEGCFFLLAVDDRGGMLPTIERLLGDTFPDCTVVSAPNGREALGQAAQNPILCAIVDLQSADFGSVQLCRQLKAGVHTRGIHVVLVTDPDTGSPARADAWNAGAEYLVSRPIDDQELIACVRAIRQASRTEAELRATLERRDERLREQERQLRESEERFRGMFQGGHDGILLADPDGTLVMANDAMCRMLGYSNGELLALNVTDIHPQHDLSRVLRFLERQIANEGKELTDVQIKCKDGTAFLADVNSTPIQVAGRDLMVNRYRNNTERHTLQASIAQADRLASMGMLAAGVAHEINNPLTYVVFNLETLSEDMELIARSFEKGESTIDGRLAIDFDDVVERANDALEGSYKIKELTGALGTFSHVEADDETKVDLQYVLDSAANMAFNEFKYRATLAKDYDEVPKVMAAEGQLSQVFLNLLLNAAHAIDEGNVAGNEIRIRNWVSDNDIVVEVKDTGRGIAAEDLPRVMEPFFTTKEVGTASGMGLTICNNIVEKLGGYIRVESELGHGTRVTIRLPIEDISHDSTVDRKVDRRISRSGITGRIMIVDDDELLRATLARALSEHEVITAASGEEGQAILRMDKEFDVLICDVMMPEMSGMDLHEWMVRQSIGLAQRTIFITGGIFTSKARKYIRDVDVKALKKPLDMVTLKELVSEQIVRARE